MISVRQILSGKMARPNTVKRREKAWNGGWFRMLAASPGEDHFRRPAALADRRCNLTENLEITKGGVRG
jgi:hypothetical protein